MNRNSGLDLVRVLGTVAIVAGHVWVDLTPWLYTWHVALFFFLAGWLWSPTRSLRTEILRRAQTLLVPYVSWFAMTFALFAGAYLWVDGAVPRTAAEDALWGGAAATRPFTTFWFFTALFVSAVVWRLVARCSLALRAATGVASLVALAVAGPAMARPPLDVGVGVGCVGFVAAGQFLRRIDLQWPAGLALVTIGIAVSGVGIVEPLTLKNGDLGTPALSVVVGIAISWGLVVVATRWTPEAPAISRLALLAPAVILFHPVALWLLAVPPNGTLMDGVLVVVLTGAVAFVAALGPWRRLLLGHDDRVVTRVPS